MTALNYDSGTSSRYAPCYMFYRSYSDATSL